MGKQENEFEHSGPIDSEPLVPEPARDPESSRELVPVRERSQERSLLRAKLDQGDLTDKIIGAAIQVHRELGPGFLESIYENVLVIELKSRGLPFDRQLEVPVFYHGTEVGRHRLDLFVDKEIVVELKTIKALEDLHFADVGGPPPQQFTSIPSGGFLCVAALFGDDTVFS